MPHQHTAPSFAVIPGSRIAQVVDGRSAELVRLIEDAYRLHGTGGTVNPPSHFLRFPDRPTARIIALPASLGGESGTDGLKWISSFPQNVAAGLPRASAVLILNDPRTGYPYACLESSVISAVRTAASAALAADRLSADRERPARVGFFGVGLIARYLHRFLRESGWSFDEVGVHDLSAEHAKGFTDYLHRYGETGRVTVHDTPQGLIRSSDLVVFATVAGTPHVSDPGWFAHHPLVLHVSLRDLSPEVVLGATNIVDDVDHCLRADTSLHLAEQRVGHRDFVHGTLHDVLTGRLRPPAGRPVVFSPFGLGALDLAVGKHVYDTVRAAGDLLVIDDFFHEMRRYG
ncbi:2,3-diaminopropionate biosynthesis protein SbnB [Streptomyces sp. NPDC059788]|uniref:2,3-diaminopropionate biosynthesis protein SbnB n=1 Tax=Streptomyces sp. NPDC059788 TaxID=3346948 RepID=UPI0036639AE4